jgi:hypothetical protein
VTVCCAVLRCAGVVVFDDPVTFSGTYAAVLSCGDGEDYAGSCAIKIYPLVRNPTKMQTEAEYRAAAASDASGGGGTHPCPYNPAKPWSNADLNLKCFMLQSSDTAFNEEPSTVITVPYGASGLSYDADGLLIVTFNSGFRDRVAATLKLGERPQSAVMRVRVVRWRARVCVPVLMSMPLLLLSSLLLLLLLSPSSSLSLSSLVSLVAAGAEEHHGRQGQRDVFQALRLVPRLS